ncbi:MAG: hypothetical protein ACRC2J_20195 [Microcoleaceae cyanobacterium]
MFVTLTDIAGDKFTINTNHIVSIRNSDGFLPNIIELIGGRTIHVKDEESLEYLKSVLKVINEDQRSLLLML